MKKIYNQEIQRVEGIKKVVIHITDGSHAEFLIKLKYHELTQKKFFSMMMESYLKDDKDLLYFINKKMEEKISVRRRKNKIKDLEETEETIKNFGLDDEEIENIFDIIEKENPDL